MAIIFDESFERGASGLNVSTSLTNFTSFIGASDILFDNDFVLNDDGALSMRVAPSTSAQRYGQIVYASAPTMLYRRLYIYLPSAPPFTFSFAAIVSGTTIRGDIRVTTNGSLIVRNGTTNVHQTPIGEIPAGEWVRVEWHIDPANGTQQALLYRGANLHGNVASYDTGPLTYSQGNITASRTGVTTAATPVIHFDALKDSDTEWVGSAVTVVEPPPDDPAGVGYRTGGVWASKTMQRRESGVWVDANFAL